jgi:hypothetical protein
MQKENLFFFAFPSACNFGKARVTKKRGKCKRKSCFFGIFEVLTFKNTQIYLGFCSLNRTFASNFVIDAVIKLK